MSINSKEEQNAININDAFSKIIHYSNQIAICLSEDLKITDLSLEAEKLYGILKADILGKDYTKALKSNQMPTASDLKRISSDSPLINFEGTFIAAKGVKRVLNWTAFCLISSADKVCGYMLLGKDVTDHKLYLQALEAKELAEENSFKAAMYLESLVASMPGTVYWKNREGTYLGCNENQMRALGLKSRADFIGKTIYEVVDEGYSHKLAAVDEEVMLSGRAMIIEEDGPREDGTRGIYLTHKVPLKDKNDQVIGMLGVSFDITERKQLESELQVAKAAAEKQFLIANFYLEKIIDNIPANVYWKDENGIILGCNEQQAKIFGLQKEDLIGKTTLEVAKANNWEKELADKIMSIDDQVVITGNPVTVEETIVLANGELMDVLSHKTVLRGDNGEIVGVLGISVDISDRKRIEKDLHIAKDRAESANRSKSEFLAAVSHELRIPLTGILGMARLLVDDEMPEPHRKQIKDIIMSGEHLLALVSDLLDLAKFEAGKLELNPGPLNFRKLIEEITTMLNFQATTKSLELITDYADDAPHMLIGDSRALRQILLNLMGNAVKFTEHGHVKICVYCTDREQLRANLTIIVEDTGIGIPADKKDSVFERFNQVDSSRTRRYGGAGLGLTITKAYVELMGGSISVESEVGKGTQFICKIPFDLQEMTHRPSAWEQYKSLVRVLIIDDTQRGDMLFNHLDSPLVKAAHGEEGFNTLMAAYHQKQHFHIVIIDQQLQSTDAMELGRKIKSQPDLIQPMMVLLMPPSTLPLKESAKASGFYEILTKPVHPSDLYVTLTAAWERWEESHRSTNKVIPAFAQHQPQILLVEDDPIIQKVHTMMLERVGCKIGVASNGNEALKMFMQGYDAILMDVGLPGMSGIEVATEIRKLEAGNGRIPIIGVTGYGYEEDKRNCLEAGMDDVAVKPLKPDELTQILLKWVAGAKPFT